MPLDPAALPPEVLAFVTERHLATLTTLRPDGSPHVTPVGFTWDPDSGLVRIITFGGSAKVRHLTHDHDHDRSGALPARGPRRPSEPTPVADQHLAAAERSADRADRLPSPGRRPHRAAVCQVDGGRWLTFEGQAQITQDPRRVAEAVRRYAIRYRPPSERPDRVAIEIAVDRVLGRA